VSMSDGLAGFNGGRTRFPIDRWGRANVTDYKLRLFIDFLQCRLTKKAAVYSMGQPQGTPPGVSAGDTSGFRAVAFCVGAWATIFGIRSVRSLALPGIEVR
jgi:hypothetical protein